MSSGLTEKIVDKAMAKYGVPKWARPYVYKHVRKNKVESIKQPSLWSTLGEKKAH